MKTLKYLIPVVLLLIAVGCYKDITDDITEPQQKDMSSLKISSDFDWRLSQNITVAITSEFPQQLKITSVESDTIVYYKGNHPGNNDQKHIKISVPTAENAIIVNGNNLPISSLYMEVDLATLKSSDVNNSIYFYGTDDYGVIDPLAHFNGATEFTIEGWAKHDSKMANSRLVHMIGLGLNEDISIAPYGGKFYVELGNGSNSFGVWNDYGTSTETDGWYHFAVVYDDGAGANNDDKLKLYINGVEQTLAFTGTIPSSTADFSAADIYVASDDVPADFFEGNIDDLRFWDHARTVTEINAYKDVQLEEIAPSTPPTGLLANYKFDEYDGADESPEAFSLHTNIALFNDHDIQTSKPYFYDPDNDGVDNETDDYPDDPLRAYETFHPAAGFWSVAFEDLWPGKGDYDFNDVVIDYRFKTVKNASDEVVEIFGFFKLKASGAFMHNGFGFSLPDANNDFVTDPSKFEVTGYDIQGSIITLNGHGHEDGQSHPTIIVFDDFYNVMEHPGGGLGINTDNWAPFVDYETVRIKIVPAAGYTENDFSLTTWNPFIFVDQDRSHEVHLPDMEPTDLMNYSLLGTEEDDSDQGIGRYYKTESNLPWAIDIPFKFAWPREKAEIVWTYNHFAEWAESSGVEKTDWYKNKSGYRVQSNIYVPNTP